MVKIEPLFESKQQLNDSVDNRTQSKLFNRESSLIVPKQDQTPNHVKTVFPISAVSLFVVFVHFLCLFFLSFERNEFETFINTQMIVC